jgi:coenzyme F420-reducing hydrogenase alpha subunit
MSARTITIEPITRLEGHGKIEIFLNEGLLNRVEMAFRAYDPCLACATHFAVGQMPLQINIQA